MNTHPNETELMRTIRYENWLQFSREHARIVGFFRRALFNHDYEALRLWNERLRQELAWSYKDQKPQWDKANRAMGGLEMMYDLVGAMIDMIERDMARMTS